MRIAIIQPYFFPYMGYFKLFSATDLVVILDCVQFPRRGFVHRNKFMMLNNKVEWISLPYIREHRDKQKIHKMRFPKNSSGSMLERFENAKIWISLQSSDFYSTIFDTEKTITAYLLNNILLVNSHLGLHSNVVCSSSLSVPGSLNGETKILYICEHLGATNYVNLPGGLDYYHLEAFRKINTKLSILEDNVLDRRNILDVIFDHAVSVESIKDEIFNNIAFVNV